MNEFVYFSLVIAPHATDAIEEIAALHLDHFLLSSVGGIVSLTSQMTPEDADVSLLVDAIDEVESYLGEDAVESVVLERALIESLKG